MLETIIFGQFFLGSEPEALLFMLYTFLFIWSAALRSTPKEPIVGAHLLDIVEAATTNEAYATERPLCEASSEGTCAPQIISAVTQKYCGRTVGEIAVNCGITLAASVYLDPRRFEWIDERSKRIIHKKMWYVWSHGYGKYVNYRADLQEWWDRQRFERKEHSAQETKE